MLAAEADVKGRQAALGDQTPHLLSRAAQEVRRILERPDIALVMAWSLDARTLDGASGATGGLIAGH